jgi:hypothetical protein
LSRLIRDYSILRFTASDAVTSTGDDTISTWYKLKILEAIHLQPRIPQDKLQLNIPPALLPLRDSETFYSVDAGSVVIEGVRITAVADEKGLLLRKGQEYVGGFYLEDGSHYAVPAAGAAGIYELHGDELKPQAEQDDKLVKDVQQVLKNRLSWLRFEVQRQLDAR